MSENCQRKHISLQQNYTINTMINWVYIWYNCINEACVISALCSLLQVNGGIEQQLKREVLEYDYHNSFFDIFVSNFFFSLHSYPTIRPQTTPEPELNYFVRKWNESKNQLH